jgi:hypothetical protein
VERVSQNQGKQTFEKVGNVAIMIVANIKHMILYRLKEDITVPVEITQFDLGKNHAKIAADNCLASASLNSTYKPYIVYTGTIVYPKDSVIYTTLRHRFYCPRIFKGKPVVENKEINPLLVKLKTKWEVLEGKEVEPL